MRTVDGFISHFVNNALNAGKQEGNEVTVNGSIFYKKCHVFREWCCLRLRLTGYGYELSNKFIDFVLIGYRYDLIFTVYYFYVKPLFIFLAYTFSQRCKCI